MEIRPVQGAREKNGGENKRCIARVSVKRMEAGPRNKTIYHFYNKRRNFIITGQLKYDTCCPSLKKCAV
jgi:hypothetical protein